MFAGNTIGDLKGKASSKLNYCIINAELPVRDHLCRPQRERSAAP